MEAHRRLSQKNITLQHLRNVKSKLSEFGKRSQTYRFGQSDYKLERCTVKEYENGIRGHYCQNCFNTFKNAKEVMHFENDKENPGAISEEKSIKSPTIRESVKSVSLKSDTKNKSCSLTRNDKIRKLDLTPAKEEDPSKMPISPSLESSMEKLVKIKSSESFKREFLSPQPSDGKRSIFSEDIQRQKINPNAKVKLVEKKVKYLPQLMKLKKHLDTGMLSGIDFNVFNTILNSQAKEAEINKQKFGEDKTQDHTIKE